MMRFYNSQHEFYFGVDLHAKTLHVCVVDSSGATDFARSLPSHVAAEICGHTEQIAQKHYWQVSDSDLDLAIWKLSPGIERKLATKLAQDSDSKGLESSFDDSRAERDNDEKARKTKAFVAHCLRRTYPSR